jgi:hypothetical protein
MTLRSARRWFNNLLLAVVVLAATSYHAAHANVGFRYDMSRATTVDIALALPDGNPALLSFYSEGKNGLQLLENAFTDTQGYYAGQLQLPSHLSQVVVVVRAAERQDTLTLSVNADVITYAE